MKAESTSHGSSTRILIVEDDPTWAEALYEMYSRIFGSDCEVARASNEEDALAMLRRTGVRLLSLDVNLITSNGLKILSEASRKRKVDFVVVVSGLQHDEDIDLTVITEAELRDLRSSTELVVEQYVPRSKYILCHKPRTAIKSRSSVSYTAAVIEAVHVIEGQLISADISKRVKIAGYYARHYRLSFVNPDPKSLRIILSSRDRHKIEIDNPVYKRILRALAIGKTGKDSELWYIPSSVLLRGAIPDEFKEITSATQRNSTSCERECHERVTWRMENLRRDLRNLRFNPDWLFTSRSGTREVPSGWRLVDDARVNGISTVKGSFGHSAEYQPDVRETEEAKEKHKIAEEAIRKAIRG